jgi:leucyl aminopeptidase
MKLSLSSTDLVQLDADLLGVIVDDPSQLPASLHQLDAHLGGALRRELERGLLKADAAGSQTITGADSGPGAITLLSYGPIADGRGDAMRVAGAKFAATARARKAHTVALVAPEHCADSEALVEGVILGTYRVYHYRSDTQHEDTNADDTRYDGPTDLVLAGEHAHEHEEAATRAQIRARAQNWARDLANAPANRLMPIDLAREAQELSDAHAHLSVRSLGREELLNKGMGMFAGVAQGSFDEPRLIVLEWNPPNATETDEERLALLGKAVVFDTGGISIKPSQGMEGMKLDKSGGCAVLGAMRAIAELNIEHRVIAVIGATTNMPDGNAYRPGDVVTAMDGTTVEIISTDAEGRLVLGDCISYLRELGCGSIVAASTLTGAMVIALGHRYTGAIARRGTLINAVIAAGERTGDHAWHLPLHEEYKANLKTDCADLKNSGSRDGGALSAGAFLEHFAKDTPFVHLDVAGTAMLPKPRLWYGCKGASGWGVRLLTQLAESYRASS